MADESETIEARTPGKKEENTTLSSIGGAQYELHAQMYANTRDIEKLKQELTGERLNNITIFGIFASLVTFLIVDIQIFKNIDNFWLLIGFISFFVSCLLLFVFSIFSIAKDRLSWREFFGNPLFCLFMIFLIFSFVVFIFHSQGVNIELKIQS